MGLMVGVLLLVGCANTQQTTTYTNPVYSTLYNPSEYSLNLDYKFYHLNDGMTSMFIRMFPGELLFNTANEDAELRAQLDIIYNLYELDSTGAAVAKVDSSVLRFVLGAEEKASSAYFATRVMNIPSGKLYMAELRATDVQRGSIGLDHLFVDKTDILSAQNFVAVSQDSRFPKFLNYFRTGEVFNLRYRIPGADSIYIDYFLDENPFPRPPVDEGSASFFPIEPDTTYKVPFSDTTSFMLPDPGMYHFRIDSASRKGITLLNLGGDYPQVTTEESLLGPLFYLTTQTEYRNLLRAGNTKKAVDDWWLARNIPMDRSRELIRVYYNRVLYSNFYFTADREGWKTDRGMLFILLGPPDRIMDTGDKEYWFYIGRRRDQISEFVFERQTSRYSNHDLIWDKDFDSLTTWINAVNSWRAGKVYTFGRR